MCEEFSNCQTAGDAGAVECKVCRTNGYYLSNKNCDRLHNSCTTTDGTAKACTQYSCTAK